MNSQAQLSAAQQLASGAGAGVPNLQNSGVGGGDDDDDDGGGWRDRCRIDDLDE